jgi:hypothetical protein
MDAEAAIAMPHTPEELFREMPFGDLADEGDAFTAAYWSQADGFSPMIFWATGRSENEALEVAVEIAEERWRREIADEEDLAYQLEANGGEVWKGRRGPFHQTEFGEAPSAEDIRRRRRQRFARGHRGPKDWAPGEE